MIKFIKITAAILVTMIIAPATTLAADASVELNVNDSDFEARLDVLVNSGGAPLTVGGGFLYSDDDDFWLYYDGVAYTINGANWAAAHGADIINIGFGTHINSKILL